ncbi:MAG: polymerase sigma-70 factor, subfamily [Actinomycetota bacterium]|jgi:RNA polymerase sigma-70 factor (ECF subfamily)|nr:polymerase sigma-70 factor, subfamily [Actinomycetota bacterium]MDQ1503446.1 polymerase sigma-70 factor, subfamily [Actinomycetota bacterium]
MQAERYPTEGALLAGAAGGDPDAVRALIDSVGPVVYGFVFARVGGDEPTAQDLLQESLIEALRSAPTFRGDASLRTWVCAIARRRLARHYEAERRQAVAESGLALLGGIGLAGPSGTSGDELERRDEIVRALGRLPAVHRQVLVMKYLDDLSVSAIADELGRSPVQVQSLLQRARDGLRRALEGDPGAD